MQTWRVVGFKMLSIKITSLFLANWDWSSYETQWVVYLKVDCLKFIEKIALIILQNFN